MPVLGLIFLRHADNRFKAYLPEIEAHPGPMPTGSGVKALIKLGLSGQGRHLPARGRALRRIAGLPRGAKLAEAIDAAMDAIEAEYTVLEGALPHGLCGLRAGPAGRPGQDLRPPALKIRHRRRVRAHLRILPQQVRHERRAGGGEFFTPPSLVRLIVNVIEPDHGTVLDPACGSAGMFVQTGHFIEDVRHARAPARRHLPRPGEERHQHQAGAHEPGGARAGRQHPPGQHLLRRDRAPDRPVRFRHGQPPFNVDGVTEEVGKSNRRQKQAAREGGRLPFGLPGTNAKTKAQSPTPTVSGFSISTPT
jgi:type I restriction enzyme M protein